MKEFISKAPFGLLLFLYLGYVAYDYYSFTTDPQSPLIQKTNEIETAKKEALQIQAKIKQSVEFQKSLELKKTQLREMAQRLDEMKSTLTEDVDIADFIKLVVTEAKKVGINVVSLKPLKTNKAEFYAEQTFDLAFRGVYVQLIVFLERLSNVNKIVRVDNFSMKPLNTAGNSRYVELEGVIELKTYRYLASKADEIAGGTK